jgi:hypothetical protein
MCQLSYLLEGMLKYRPEERIGFTEIISILHSFFNRRDENRLLKEYIISKSKI